MKMRKYIIINLILIIILASAFFSGCFKTRQGDIVIASIGNYKITLSDFNERINNLPKRFQRIVLRRKNEYLQELISDTILYKEALNKGLDKDEETVKVIEEARRKILIARLLHDEIDENIEVTDEDVVDFYEKNKNSYLAPELYRVSHILVASRGGAETIITDISKGASFESLARERSIHPTSAEGGDIGFFPKGQLIPEFEKACEELKPGEVSGIVETKLGYHIIKLTDKRLPKQKPLNEVEAKIKYALRAAKRKKMFNELLEKLRKKTKISINQEALSLEAAGKTDEKK